MFEELSEEMKANFIGRLNKLPEYEHAECYITLGEIRSAVWKHVYGIIPREINELNSLIINEKEKILNYISPLLRKGELLMLVHRYNKNNRMELIETRLSSPETSEDDIIILREEWNKFPDDPFRTESATWFFLPQYKHIFDKN